MMKKKGFDLANSQVPLTQLDVSNGSVSSQLDKVVVDSKPGLEVPKEKEALGETAEEGRGNWGGKIEFVLTLVGYSVGLGNVWRFPYLTYKNGGGAFLIPFVLSLFIIGLPLFFLETAIGQFASIGPTRIWAFSRLFKGIGIGMTMVALMMSLYYIIIVAWIIFYFFASMQSPLPWISCDNPWNTVACFTKDDITLYRNLTTTNGTWLKGFNLTAQEILKFNRTPESIQSPSQEYFYRNVLDISDGLEHPGVVRWQLACCLFLGWLVVFFVLIKGINSLGKVAYFTSIFPYILLTIMLIRGCTLPGAIDGIKFYMIPKWERLADATVWSDAAVQIFYALSCCSGGLIAMASYNKFNNNVRRDSLFVPIINVLTSIYAGFVIFSVLGYMAKEKGVQVKDVAASGPGLVFVVYPEALATMDVAPLWSVLFFFMMATLGFSSQFANVECVFSCIMDEFPHLFEKKSSSIILRAVGTLVMYLLGLPMITQGGFYLFNICDKFVGGFPLLILGLAEFIVVIYVYGYKFFAEDIKMMLGVSPGPYFAATWLVASPVALFGIIISKAVQQKPLKLEDYVYPPWGEALGWLMVVGCVAWIPICFFYIYCANGGFELLKRLRKPLPRWGPALKENRTGRYAEIDRKIAEEKEIEAMYDNPAFVPDRTSMLY